MKTFKKIFAVLLCIAIITACFAGCSSATEADEITEDTMLIAYTEENAPFLYTGDDGELTGFDVEIFEAIFDDIKNDYKNYEFIQVPEGYKIGEDTAYTDNDGNEYVAYIMAGGVQTNTGTLNKDFTVSEAVIENNVSTIVALDSGITSYADFDGKNIGVVSEIATAALDKNSTIENACKSVVVSYDDIESAYADLNAKKIDAIVTDDFSLSELDSADNYTVLNGKLETINYVYAFDKYDSLADSVNEAIYELKSTDYNDADEFTPIVEKYFGYNASNFDYQPVKN